MKRSNPRHFTGFICAFFYCSYYYPINLISVDYYDSSGKLLKNYLEKPIALKNLASILYVIKNSDKTGGSGAKFIVRWDAETAVNPPLIEAIMISTTSQQGISFVSRGLEIKE